MPQKRKDITPINPPSIRSTRLTYNYGEGVETSYVGDRLNVMEITSGKFLMYWDIFRTEQSLSSYFGEIMNVPVEMIFLSIRNCWLICVASHLGTQMT